MNSEVSSIDSIEQMQLDSFEVSFSRLETILEQMNTGTVSLDESLKLYEEAEKLIAKCSNLLNKAEKRIEILVKNRQGELSFNGEGKPLVEKY